MEVEEKKRILADPEDRPLIFSEYDKEGERGKIVRRQSDPVHISKLVGQAKRKSGLTPSLDSSLLQTAWQNAVGEKIAGMSEIKALANGVLHVEIFSSPLLQEIRQFLAEEILHGLRNNWPGETPLLRITYKLGERVHKGTS